MRAGSRRGSLRRGAKPSGRVRGRRERRRRRRVVGSRSCRVLAEAGAAAAREPQLRRRHGLGSARVEAGSAVGEAALVSARAEALGTIKRT